MTLKSKVSFCAKEKSSKQATVKEKIKYLKKAGFNDKEIEYIGNKEAGFANRVIELAKKNVPCERALELAELSDEEFKKALELIEKGVQPYQVPSFFKLEKRERKKADCAIDKGVYGSFTTVSKLDDKTYSRILYLMKFEMGTRIAKMLASLDDEAYQDALFILQKGAEPSEAYMFFSRINKKVRKEIIELMKKGATFEDAFACTTNETIKKSFDSYLNSGLNIEISSILAKCCEEYIEKSSVATIVDIIKAINDNSKKSPNFSHYFNNFLERTLEANQNPDDFKEYISKINFKRLKQIAPFMNKYTNEQLLDFIEWHYYNATKEFNSETLAIQGGLTKVIEENYLTAEQLNSFLLAHPLTKREVGQIPSDWFSKIPKEKQESATKEIYSAIHDFQKTKNTNKLSSDLSRILNKKVEVEKLEKGAYGTGYKISQEDAKAACLKIFHAYGNKFYESKHGQNIEVQTGMFLNNHSNDFVKMFFGKVATKYTRDGFLVTEFLDKKTKPTKIKNISNNYQIYYSDNNRSNKINGTIIDYGSTTVIKIL